MGWARLDDKRVLNPKLLKVGLAARGLDEAGICYCAAHETDGLLIDQAVDMLGAAHGEKRPHRLAQKLVDEGRWERDDEAGGYRIHDYLEYNPSKAQITQERERKRQAGAMGAAKRWGVAPAIAGPIGDPTGTRDAPDPTRPVPDPFGVSSVSEEPPPPLPSAEEDGPSAKGENLSVVGRGAAALLVIAGRRLERTRSTVTNPGAWRLTCYRRLANERLAEAEDLASRNPDLGPHELADILEPPRNGATPQPGGPVVPAPFEPDTDGPTFEEAAATGRQRLRELRG